MKHSKIDAVEVRAQLNEARGPMLVAKNAETKEVAPEAVSSKVSQETLTLLKILEFSQREIEQGRFSPAAEAFARVRASRA